MWREKGTEPYEPPYLNLVPDPEDQQAGEEAAREAAEARAAMDRTRSMWLGGGGALPPPTTEETTE